MIFILFGTRSRAKTIDRGRFFCPECRSRRSYALKEVTRYGHLYFIPVLPLDKVAKYVECAKCRGTFVPAVLTSTLQGKSRRIEARFHKGVRGVLVHMMMADGGASEVELEAVGKIYRSVTGSSPDEKELRKQAKSAKWRRELGLMASLGALSVTLNDQGKKVILRAAARVATVDGMVGYEEHNFLLKIGESLEMPKEEVARVLGSMKVGSTADDTSSGKMPGTVAEAVAHLVGQLSEEDKKRIRNLPEDELISLHFGLGMWIRNHLGLWGRNARLLEDTGKTDRDAASMHIIRALWDHLQHGEKASWWQRFRRQ